MEELSYTDLLMAFTGQTQVDVEFWKKVARIERSIPRYNNKYTWWERAINFCNTYIAEHTVENKSVTIAGLWNIKLQLNRYDDHSTFHSGCGKGLTDFYFMPTGEKTDLKIVPNIGYGLQKYATLPLSHNSDSLLFYCTESSKYYMLMPTLASVELNNYYTYDNDRFIYYEVNLPQPKLLSYIKPVSDLEEIDILAGLPDYRYIRTV